MPFKSFEKQYFVGDNRKYRLRSSPQKRLKTIYYNKFMTKLNNMLKKINPVNIIKNYKLRAPELKQRDAIRIASWGIPIALIPSFRYLQDKNKKPSLRKELFLRDFSTYSVGIGFFMGTALAAQKLFNLPFAKNVSKGKKFVLPEIIASVVYCVWAGLLAPKLSQKVNKEGAGMIDSSKVKLANSLSKPVNFTRTLQAYRSNSLANLYSGFRI